jgi:hypothetical protein
MYSAENAAPLVRAKVLLEQRVAAFALGIPASGRPGSPPSWASPDGVPSACRPTAWRVPAPPQLENPRAKRYGLVAGYAPHQPHSGTAAAARHLHVEHPGQPLQLDCFCIGRLSRTKGTVAVHRHRRRLRVRLGHPAGYPPQPSAHWASWLARQVADLAIRGWKLERVMTDNAAEFRSAIFGQTITRLGARQSFIGAGRPRRTAAWSGSTRRSWTSAGSPPLRATCIPGRPTCGSTWNTTPSEPHRPLDPWPHPLMRFSGTPSCGTSADASPQLGTGQPKAWPAG